ncbi:hypothetical protein [Algoriphagus boritolerans]|uniref:hypothetical protein n=1 Tax=Algoriphagus boritolerans TaxID=308111 RepID=UPI002FCE1E28
MAFVLGSMVFVGLIEISLMVTVLIVVILSSKLKGKSLELSIGAVAILIAVISNTLVKMGIGIYAAAARFAKIFY